VGRARRARQAGEARPPRRGGGGLPRGERPGPICRRRRITGVMVHGNGVHAEQNMGKAPERTQ